MQAEIGSSNQHRVGQAELDNVPCGVVDLHLDLRVVRYNVSFALLGLPNHQLNIGRPFEQMLSPASRLAFQMHLVPQLELVGHAEEVVIELIDESGPLPCLLYARRKGEADQPGYRCVVAPIRQRQGLERELVRARRAANQVPGGVFQMLVGHNGTISCPYASSGFGLMFGLSNSVLRIDATALFGRVHRDDRRAFYDRFTNPRMFDEEATFEFRSENGKVSCDGSRPARESNRWPTATR
jgi:hypothetical protein